jgi:HNH endonuclease
MIDESLSVSSLILGMFILAVFIFIAYAYLAAIFGGTKEKERRKKNRDRRWGKIDRQERTPGQIFPSEVRNKVIEWTEGKCFHCGTNLLENGNGYWEVDHLWPKKFGGVDELFNLVASCQPCNKQKGATEPFCALVYKWTWNVQISDFEMKFLYFYSQNSPVRLTTNPTWRAEIANWSESIRQFTQDLEADMRGELTEKKRKKLQSKYISIFSEF